VILLPYLKDGGIKEREVRGGAVVVVVSGGGGSIAVTPSLLPFPYALL